MGPPLLASQARVDNQDRLMVQVEAGRCSLVAASLQLRALLLSPLDAAAAATRVAPLSGRAPVVGVGEADQPDRHWLLEHGFGFYHKTLSLEANGWEELAVKGRPLLRLLSLSTGLQVCGESFARKRARLNSRQANLAERKAGCGHRASRSRSRSRLRLSKHSPKFKLESWIQSWTARFT